MHTYFKSGTWNVICDACGRRRKADEVRKRWDGYMVCSDTCWEPRHPLDFIRGRPDNANVPYVRPEPTDVFVPMHFTAQPSDNLDISEAITLAFGSAVSDSISFSEAIGLTWSFALTDTLSITESITVRLIQPNPLNAYALNVKTLG